MQQLGDPADGPGMNLRTLAAVAALAAAITGASCHNRGRGASLIVDTTSSSVQLTATTGVVANGTESTTLSITVVDFEGMPLAGWTVTPSVSGSNNTLAPPAGVTDSMGVFQSVLTSTTAELKTISVSVSNGQTGVLGDQPSVEFIGDIDNVSAGLSTATAGPTSNVAPDGVATSTITVTVRDVNGNAVPNADVALAATGTGNTLVQPLPTDASGVATGTIASTVAEQKVISATVDPAGSPTQVTMQPTIVFGAPTVDVANSTVSATPPFGTLANGTDLATITVTVLDTAGMPAAGETVELAATGTENTFAPMSGMTDAAGVFTATLATTLAEAKIVTATVNPGANGALLNATGTAEFSWPIPGTWYVRTTGSDSANGMSPASAFGTLAAAAIAAMPGDTVYVGGGTHQGPLDITSGGTPGDPIRWIADPFGTFTGDAGEVIVDAMGGDYAIRISSATDVVIDGFTILGGGSATSGAIDVVGSSDRALITRNRLYGNATAVRVSSADDAIVEDNRISNNTARGIVIELGADDAAVANNLVYGNGAEGIIADGVTGLSINLNTLYLNTGGQLVALNSSTATATNNIVADGLADGIVQIDVTSALGSNNNNSFGNAGQNWQGLAPGAGDISADPLFEDPDGADNMLGGANGDDDRLQVDPTGPSLTIDAGSADASTFTLASGDTATDRTTRSDDLLDGESPDGTTVNMGYHYLPNVDPLSDLDVDDGRLFYGEGASSRPRVRDWDDSASSWAAESPTAPAATRIQYAVHEQSILADGEEYLVIQSTDGATTDLEMVTWTGNEWRRDWSTPAIDVVHADKRGFDFGFEQASAHGILVHSDNTETPVYRTRELGQWSDALPLPLNDAGGPNPDPNTGIVLWVELVEKPGSNEVTLLYADANSDLVAIVWDGAQWLTATTSVLETSLKTNPISGFVHSRTFDGAYETQSGDFLAAWGRESAAGFFHSSRASGANSFSTASNVFSQNGNTHYCDLAAEPGTDRIAGGFYDLGDGTERLGLSTWDGAAWQNTVELDSQILDVNDMGQSDFPGEVAWLGTTGQAICVYPDNETATLDWASWTAAGGWVLGADLAVPGMGTGESAFLRPFPNQDRVLAAFSGSNGNLYSATYDGTDWTLTNGGAPLETNLSTIGAAPFSFAFER